MTREVIVWVDDHVRFQAGLLQALKECGFRVIPIPTVVTAKAYLDEHQNSVELIIFDLIIPGDTGGISYERHKGIALALHGLVRGVKRFLAYTVLGSQQATVELESFGAELGKYAATDGQLKVLNKAEASSAEFREVVVGLLAER